MGSGKLVAYYRVSTARQEVSGLGLDAQRQAVRAFASDAAVVAEFTSSVHRSGLASLCRCPPERQVSADTVTLLHAVHGLR